MPKGIHANVEIRLERAKAKRTQSENRLSVLIIRQAQIETKEGKTRNQIARWDIKIAKLEAQMKAQEAVTPNP